ncbi:MAG: serine/threonine-protein kinase [Planctomycetota bacterium]
MNREAESQRSTHEGLLPIQQLDAICDRFEAQWLSGETPSIGDYLVEVSDDLRGRLLRELLQLELEYRPEPPEELRHRWLVEYPHDRGEIEQVIALASGRTITPRAGLEDTQPVDVSIDLSQVHDFDAVSGRVFGGYELIDEIARGGMGVVFRARQIDVNRIVAMKMILSGELAGKIEVDRFKMEAEAAAKLDHPNIVPIFEVGQHKGQHYFSMGYVDGPSLKQHIRDQPVRRREAADIIRVLARAIDYAHGKGVIHRDLKPANILMDAGGNPRITDFGLSKLVDGNAELTGTGQLLGTPAYMSPEQAAGRTSEIGPLTDVYALGAILYELITGTVPFRSESVIEVLTKIRCEEPTAPRSISRQIDPDIETICIKCLDKDPQRRYASAGALADDLDRYLAGEAVHARPIKRAQKVVRWCRRRPLIASLIAGLAASFLVFGGLATHFAVMSQVRGVQVASEREKADEMLGVAQLAIDGMVEQADLLADVPRTETRRKQLLVQATEFYERFITERPGDFELRFRTAKLHQSMGNVFRQLDEFDASETAFKTSIDLMRGLDSRTERRDAEVRREMAESYIWMAVLLQTRDVDRALESIQRAVDIQDRYASLHPSDQASQFILARALYNRGMLRSQLSDREAAEQDYVDATRRFESLIRNAGDGTGGDTQDPGGVSRDDVRRDLGRTLNNFGNLLIEAQDFEAAKMKIEAAIALYSGDFLNRSQRQDLAIFRNNLSNTLVQLNRLDEAIVENEKSVAILEKLVHEFPQYTNLKNELSNALNSCGALAGRQGNLTRAEDFFARADQILQTLVDDDPNRFDFAYRLGNAKYNQALVASMLQREADALDMLDDAIVIHSRCVDANEASREYTAALRNALVLAVRTQLKTTELPAVVNRVEDFVSRFADDPQARLQAAKWIATATQVRSDIQPNGATEDTAVPIGDLAEQAVQHLRIAIELGLPRESIVTDDGVVDAFKPFQEQSEFKTLLSEIQ